MLVILHFSTLNLPINIFSVPVILAWESFPLWTNGRQLHDNNQQSEIYVKKKEK